MRYGVATYENYLTQKNSRFTVHDIVMSFIYLQIVVAIKKVASFNVTEPLMKVLSGVEYVIRKAEVSQLFVCTFILLILILKLKDWEAYANSKVSLFQQINPIKQLVLHWRRMELRYCLQMSLIN